MHWIVSRAYVRAAMAPQHCSGSVSAIFSRIVETLIRTYSFVLDLLAECVRCFRDARRQFAACAGMFQIGVDASGEWGSQLDVRQLRA